MVRPSLIAVLNVFILTPWMIQFGGHHLAINVTIVGEEQRHHTEPARCAAGKVHVRMVRQSGRWVRKTTRALRSSVRSMQSREPKLILNSSRYAISFSAPVSSKEMIVVCNA